ncbi:MAG: hypothetical protein IJC43_06125, partial [Clostridia bacterium]|nr:hypothetical protein [Clostridia bacterium]
MVTVDKDSGKITGVAKGEATVTAVLTSVTPEKRAEITVVVPPTLTDLSISPIGSWLTPGSTKELVVYPVPSDALIEEMRWEITKNEEDAFTDVDGISINEKNSILSADQPGQYTITAYAKDGSGESEVYESTEVIVSGVILSSENMSIVANATQPISYKQFGDAQGAVAWSSDMSDVADYSGGQIITSVPGTATVTISANGYTDSVRVTVSEDRSAVIEGDTVTTGGSVTFEHLMAEIRSNCTAKTG